MRKIIFSIAMVAVLLACGDKEKKAETKTDTTNTTTSFEDSVLLNSDDYKHATAGDVQFYFKDISPEESTAISDYVVSSGLFSGGSAELYITKEGDRYIYRFPITNEALADAAYMAKLETAAKAVKDNLYADMPYSFFATNNRYHTLKAFEY